MNRAILLPLALAFVFALVWLAPAEAGASEAVDPALEVDPKAREILDRAFEALGGRDRWRSIETLRFEGIYSTFSSRKPFVLHRKRPDFYRFEHFWADQELVLGYDGEEAWWINRTSFGRVPWAVPMPFAHRLEALADADFGGSRLDPEEKGHRLHYAGMGDLDGEETVTVEVDLAREVGMEIWHLDPETYLPIARISPGADMRRPREKRTFFDDYREVNGIYFPFRIDIELGFRYQSFEVERVVVDEPIPDEFFERPRDEAARMLDALAGPWAIRVESRPFAKAPFSEELLETEWRAVAGGDLLEESIAYEDFGSARNLRRWISHDRFTGTVRILRFNDLTSHVDVLEGELAGAGLVAEASTSWRMGELELKGREVWTGIGEDEWVVEWQMTADGGTTWDTLLRITYSRPSDN